MCVSYVYQYKINSLKEQGHENKEDLSTEKTIKAVKLLVTARLMGTPSSLHL